MADLFTATADRDHLRVCGRHIKPITDELLIAVEHRTTGAAKAIVLSRPRVRELHAALGRWLDEGWPGVTQTEGPLVGAS